jgi:hypothetical protein
MLIVSGTHHRLISCQRDRRSAQDSECYRLCRSSGIIDTVRESVLAERRGDEAVAGCKRPAESAFDATLSGITL